MRPAVFLDRDDTLIACRGLPVVPPASPGDLSDPNLVRLLPGVGEALASMERAGFALVVVSNQGAVARGGATLQQVEAVNARMGALLAQAGARLAGVYYCPYHPKGIIPEYTQEHPWRKPSPGMLLAASSDLGLDLSHSWLIGDAGRDVQAGIGAGLSPDRCILVDRPTGRDPFPHHVRTLNMSEAASMVLKSLPGTR